MSDKLTPEQQIAAQNEIIAAQNAKIDKLTELINTKVPDTVSTKVEVPTIPTENVVAGKKQFKWQVASFKLPGSSDSITAEEAATDAEIVKSILAIAGQSILVEVF